MNTHAPSQPTIHGRARTHTRTTELRWSSPFCPTPLKRDSQYHRNTYIRWQFHSRQTIYFWEEVYLFAWNTMKLCLRAAIIVIAKLSIIFWLLVSWNSCTYFLKFFFSNTHTHFFVCHICEGFINAYMCIQYLTHIPYILYAKQIIDIMVCTTQIVWYWRNYFTSSIYEILRLVMIFDANRTQFYFAEWYSYYPKYSNSEN